MKQNNLDIEQYRIRVGPMASDSSMGNNGVFAIPGPRGLKLICVASDGLGWDHVSVERLTGSYSISKKPPYWNEMCFIKDIFWDPEEAVIQYHPRHSKYVNLHPGVLHLWKPQNEALPEPPIELV
jgi:hypothetical protein